MNTRKIQMPREVYIGPDVIYETGEICMDLHLDNKVLVLTGPNTYDIAAKHAIESLENQDIEVDVKIVEKVSYDSVEEVSEMITPGTNVLGVGGGKVIDVAKLASYDKNVFFVSMPTTASHDCIVSPLASIKNPKTSTSAKAHAPIAVIADSKIIANSPFRLLSAGCADLISNFTAIKDWQLAHRFPKQASFTDEIYLNCIRSEALIIWCWHWWLYWCFSVW